MSGTPPAGDPPKDPKTPGWGRALFDTLTTPWKKGSVDSGTNDTGPTMNGGPVAFGSATNDASSGADNTSASADNNETFMSPMAYSSPMNHNNNQSNNDNNNSFSNLTGSNSRRQPAPTLRVSRPSENPTIGATESPGGEKNGSFSMGTGLRDSKSPWQSRKKPPRGSARSTEVFDNRPFLFITKAPQSERKRRYRPNANALIPGKLGCYDHKGRLNLEKLNQAIVSIQPSLPTMNNNASTNVYAVRGRVQWGPFDGPSRIPRSSRKKRLEADNTNEIGGEDYDGVTRSKRRKKVTFGDAEDNSGYVTTVSATPARSTLARESTPFPQQTAQTVLSPETPMFTAPGASDYDEKRSETKPRASSKLPDLPPPLDYTPGQPLSFPAEAAVPFDHDVRDGNHSQLQFLTPYNCKVSMRGFSSFASMSDVKETEYDRPPSPPPSKKKVIREEDDEEHKHVTKRRKDEGESKEEKEEIPSWVCSSCETSNPGKTMECQQCKKQRVFLGWKNTAVSKITEGKWQCQSCYVYNENDKTKCASCEAARGGTGSDNGNGGGTIANAPAPMAAASPAPSNQYAPGKITSQGFSFGAPIVSVSTGLSTGGGTGADIGGATDSATSSKKPALAFQFGGANKIQLSKPAGDPSDNPFSFGGTTFGTPSSALAPAPVGFSFTPLAASATSPKNTGGPSFGAPASTEEDKKSDSEPSSTLGSQSTSTPAASSQPGGFSFNGSKSDTKSTSPSSGDTPKITNFTNGSSSSAAPFGENGNKKPPSKPVLGNNGKSETIAKENLGFGFANPPLASGTPITFGSSANSAASKPAEAVPAPSFSGFQCSTSAESSAAAPAPTNAGFSFGSAQNASEGVHSGGGKVGFGDNSATPGSTKPKAKRTRGYQLEGDSSASTQDATLSNATPTLFGAPPADAPSASNSVNFTFGSNNTTSSSKGDVADTSKTTPSASFGKSADGGGQSDSAAPASASTPFVFGANTPAPAPSGGGDGGGGFGSQAISMPGTFGGSSASFGTGTAAGTPAPSFGATPAAAAVSFGSTPAAATVSFGSNQAAAPVPFGGNTLAQAQTPASSFSTTPGPGPSFGTGSTAAPGFGMNTPAAANAFGSQPAAASSFGATNFASSSSTSFGVTASTPAAPAPSFSFGSQNATPATTFGAPPNSAATQTGFGQLGSFGNLTPAAPAPSGFGSTPAPSFGATAFGAPQTGGFASTTPATSSNMGSGFAPNTAPPGPVGGGGPQFSIGTSNKPRRRVVRAKRPTRPA